MTSYYTIGNTEACVSPPAAQAAAHSSRHGGEFGCRNAACTATVHQQQPLDRPSTGVKAEQQHCMQDRALRGGAPNDAPFLSTATGGACSRRYSNSAGAVPSDNASIPVPITAGLHLPYHRSYLSSPVPPRITEEVFVVQLPGLPAPTAYPPVESTFHPNRSGSRDDNSSKNSHGGFVLSGVAPAMKNTASYVSLSASSSVTSQLPVSESCPMASPLPRMLSFSNGNNSSSPNSNGGRLLCPGEITRYVAPTSPPSAMGLQNGLPETQCTLKSLATAGRPTMPFTMHNLSAKAAVMPLSMRTAGSANRSNGACSGGSLRRMQMNPAAGNVSHQRSVQSDGSRIGRNMGNGAGLPNGHYDQTACSYMMPGMIGNAGVAVGSNGHQSHTVNMMGAFPPSCMSNSNYMGIPPFTSSLCQGSMMGGSMSVLADGSGSMYNGSQQGDNAKSRSAGGGMLPSSLMASPTAPYADVNQLSYGNSYGAENNGHGSMRSGPNGGFVGPTVSQPSFHIPSAQDTSSRCQESVASLSQSPPRSHRGDAACDEELFMQSVNTDQLSQMERRPESKKSKRPPTNKHKGKQRASGSFALTTSVKNHALAFSAEENVKHDRWLSRDRRSSSSFDILQLHSQPSISAVLARQRRVSNPSQPDGRGMSTVASTTSSQPGFFRRIAKQCSRLGCGAMKGLTRRHSHGERCGGARREEDARSLSLSASSCASNDTSSTCSSFAEEEEEEEESYSFSSSYTSTDSADFQDDDDDEDWECQRNSSRVFENARSTSKSARDGNMSIAQRRRIRVKSLDASVIALALQERRG